MQRDRAVVHHTLGNGEFDLFYNMATPQAIQAMMEELAKKRDR